jgi:hypothetical protein
MWVKCYKCMHASNAVFARELEADVELCQCIGLRLQEQPGFVMVLLCCPSWSLQKAVGPSDEGLGGEGVCRWYYRVGFRENYGMLLISKLIRNG